jgi:hypothetical protein
VVPVSVGRGHQVGPAQALAAAVASRSVANKPSPAAAAAAATVRRRRRLLLLMCVQASLALTNP